MLHQQTPAQHLQLLRQVDGVEHDQRAHLLLDHAAVAARRPPLAQGPDDGTPLSGPLGALPLLVELILEPIRPLPLLAGLALGVTGLGLRPARELVEQLRARVEDVHEAVEFVVLDIDVLQRAQLDAIVVGERQRAEQGVVGRVEDLVVWLREAVIAEVHQRA